MQVYTLKSSDDGDVLGPATPVSNLRFANPSTNKNKQTAAVDIDYFAIPACFSRAPLLVSNLLNGDETTLLSQRVDVTNKLDERK